MKSINEDGNKGKTIVLCGWDHIKEFETGTYWGFALAGRIKQYTEKDVLTINQTAYYEKSERIFEDSIYQWSNVERPMILIDNNGEFFDVQENRDWYDLFVFHPRSIYQNGIPQWLMKTNKLTEFNIDYIKMEGTCKIFVFNKNDNVHLAVPLFVLENEILPKSVIVPNLLKSDIKVVVSNGADSYLIQ